MRGKKHTLPGMNIEIKDNIIHIYMVKYMRKCMKMFGEDDSVPVLSLETKNIPEVREDKGTE